ncbi:hypothetical protein [Bordetella genomosp. 11]|uniref:hypothetical protein n=1 Tax=Bordetella genomosp. 11 TaxID=1416808 RepID=UPI001140371B|nr:hypothetical protein [Bordetella genomosp. 11]
MLTINADQRPFFKDYHRPDDEKRIVVILPEAHTGICLLQAQRKCVFLNHYPATSWLPSR